MSHEHNLVPYPVTLGDAPRLLIDRLRGEAVEPACLRHAGYHLVGFGLGQLDPSERPMGGVPQSAGKVMSEAELISELEVLDKPQSPQEMRAIPWGDIVRTLLPLILKWLAVVLILAILPLAGMAASHARQAPGLPQAMLPARSSPAPKVVRATCACTPLCACGCNAGGTCRCKTVMGLPAACSYRPTVRTVAPIQYTAPAWLSPAWRSAPPAYVGGACAGGR